jgi:hypothetical protein
MTKSSSIHPYALRPQSFPLYFCYNYFTLIIFSYLLRTQRPTTPQEATNYKHWQNTYASDAPTLYIAAHFYNITNLEDVRNGALPIVKEVGPYVYWCLYLSLMCACAVVRHRAHRPTAPFRNKKDLIDVEWLEGGNKVKYNTMTRYVFLPELSVGPDTDVIVNINPGTRPTLPCSGLASESRLTLILSSPSLPWCTLASRRRRPSDRCNHGSCYKAVLRFHVGGVDSRLGCPGAPFSRAFLSLHSVFFDLTLAAHTTWHLADRGGRAGKRAREAHQRNRYTRFL